MTDIDAIRKTKRYRWNHDAMWCLQGTEVNLSLIAQWMKATDFDLLLSAYDAKCEELNIARLQRDAKLCSECPRTGELVALLAERDAAVRERDGLKAAAECWDALCACYRITCMGSAGLLTKNANGYAHATFNLWTIAGKPPEGATGDEQDLHGREQLVNFITIALKNAALASEQHTRIPKRGGLSSEGDAVALATEETGKDRPAAPICKRCGDTGWIEPHWPVGPGGASLSSYKCSDCNKPPPPAPTTPKGDL